jgi:hypothetical protein
LHCIHHRLHAGADGPRQGAPHHFHRKKQENIKKEEEKIFVYVWVYNEFFIVFV